MRTGDVSYTRIGRSSDADSDIRLKYVGNAKVGINIDSGYPLMPSTVSRDGRGGR